MKKQYIVYLLMIFLVASMPGILAAASFQVTQLDCNEVAVGDTFTCVVTIENAGDSSGTINTVTLIPDSDNWMEKSSYTQSGGSVGAGESKDITFSGLKAVKGGPSNGFSEVRMDDVSDASSQVTSIQLNVIDVSVAVTNSDTSIAQGSSFITTTEITAIGNINTNITFNVDSGGCSIGDQEASVTDDGMPHGGKLSVTWNVTMGSGNCKYTISAAATGSGTKIDSTTNTITCSNCPTDGGTTSSGGGGGGGGALKVIEIGILTSAITYDLGKSEKLSFVFAQKNHSIRISNLGDTTADFIIESETQKLSLTVGEQKNVDITRDGKDDISLKLNSINILSKKARITITSLTTAQESQPQQPAEEVTEGEERGGVGTEVSEKEEVSKLVWILLRIIIIISIIVVFIISMRRLQYLKRHFYNPKTFKFRDYTRDLSK